MTDTASSDDDTRVLASDNSAPLFDAPPADQSKYSIEVLSYIKQSQLANGLRHGDYHRYRQYCSRRLRRLRVVLKWKFAKKQFATKAYPRQLTNELWLVYLLTQSERSWAFAQQLNEERTEDNPRKRFHVIKKLKRAAQHSRIFANACALYCDTKTLLQSEAYHSDIQGQYCVETGNLTEALKCFLHSKSVYVKLGEVSGVSDLRALCEERVEQQADQIRIIKYSLKQLSDDGDSVDDDSVMIDSSSLSLKLQALVKERETRQAASLEFVTFYDTTIAVNNEKIRRELVRIKALDEQARKLSDNESGSGDSGETEDDTAADGTTTSMNTAKQSLSATYSAIAQSYDSVLRLIKDELPEAKLETHRSQLFLLQSYCQYQRLNAMKARNTHYAHTLSHKYSESVRVGVSGGWDSKGKRVKPDELVIIYEKILANLTEMKETLSQSSLKSAEAANTVNDEFAVYSLYRFHFIGESYRRLKSYRESFAIFATIQQRLTALKSVSASVRTELETLRQLTVGAKLTVQSQAILDGQSAQSSQSQSVTDSKDNEPVNAIPLLQRIDDFSTELTLASWPPQYRAVASKPILFDLAFNYLEYPVIEKQKDSKEKKTETKPQAKSVASAPSAAEEEKPAAAAASGGGGLLGAVGGAVGGLGKWVGWGSKK